MTELLLMLTAACGVTDASPATGPTVHTGVITFLHVNGILQKGDKLLLVDDTGSEHNITNGSWVHDTAKATKEPGHHLCIRRFHNHDIAAIGPFTTASTFHLSRTIHPDMNLTVIIQ